MIVSTDMQQPLLNAIGQYPSVMAQASAPLNEKLRETLARMRVRMNNLEQALGQAADENFSLKGQATQLETQLQLSTNAMHLAGKRENELQCQLTDLEAQLAAYRRQALADRKEIEALKDQLFA